MTHTTFTERRVAEADRRASGWRWGAARAERRRGPKLPRLNDQRKTGARDNRRQRNRRRADRED